MNRAPKAAKIHVRLTEAVRAANDVEIFRLFEQLDALPGRMAHGMLDRAYAALAPEQRLFLDAALELYASRQPAARPTPCAGPANRRTVHAPASRGGVPTLQPRGPALQ